MEKKLREAKTPGEKIAVIEELLTIIPKHKGTERLRGDTKRRLAKLRDEQQQGKGKGKAGGGFVRVEREGAGQVALVGPANTGKSSLLKALTKAEPEIAPYPFTTRLPLPGMMAFEDIRIQLIDLPPVSTEYIEPWFPEILRNADLWLLVLDLGQDPLAQMEEVRRILAGFHLGWPGRSAPDPRPAVWKEQPVIIAANKLDLPEGLDTLELFQELRTDPFPVFGVSALERMNLDDLRKVLFEGLGLVRVYTKVPGKEADLKTPFLFKSGSTLLDLAGAVHRDFLQKLTFARIWGRNTYPGQKVSRDYALADKDVIELHD
ncbi:MAG: 50S ribosome-binding GTPase [Deltaproteobacteria bacterium]|nr:50S ribosome-binding GTPase [Deltaproteobacteria bacterium]